MKKIPATIVSLHIFTLNLRDILKKDLKRRTSQNLSFPKKKVSIEGKKMTILNHGILLKTLTLPNMSQSRCDHHNDNFSPKKFFPMVFYFCQVHFLLRDLFFLEFGTNMDSMSLSRAERKQTITKATGFGISG